jgi:hypothetical protein
MVWMCSTLLQQQQQQQPGFSKVLAVQQTAAAQPRS